MSSGRFRERLAHRTRRAGVSLDDTQVNQIEAYYLLLSHWNRKINLTALPVEAVSDQAIDRLLIEPLVAASHMGDSRLQWLDLGSGGGSPAFPIKIMRPAASLTLVEARSRKVAFLREAARELSLADVTVVHDRIETVAGQPELAGTADLITVRAVRTDEALFDCSRRLLRLGGKMMLFVTRSGTVSSRPANFTLFDTVRLIREGDSELLIYSAG